MGFFDGYNIATSGLSAQRTRINIVSSNIANAQTTHTSEGGPYKKQNVTFESVLQDNNKKYNEVQIKEIKNEQKEPLLKYEPGHPDANKEGYVAYPNINPVIEMTDLIEAMRSYEANLSSFKTMKKMDLATLDILK